LAADIRDFRSSDTEPVVALSVRAWAPTFASFKEILGPAIFSGVYGEDWEIYQAGLVRSVLAGSPMHNWVAESDGAVVGFVSAALRDGTNGTIEMLAVDPPAQGRGLGTALAGVATSWLRGAGAKLVSISTGGDTSHAAARRVYEKAGYTALPLARYYVTF
jgi:GNAT superfamily N-acetyltransferase